MFGAGGPSFFKARAPTATTAPTAPNPNYTIYANVNSGGSDLTSSKTDNETICQNNCSSNTDCYGYAYNVKGDNKCYLKNQKVLSAPRVSTTGVNLGIIAVTPRSFSSYAGKDLKGSDIDTGGIMLGPNAEPACKTSCSEDPNCYAYAYYTDGHCFRKDNKVYNTNTIDNAGSIVGIIPIDTQFAYTYTDPIKGNAPGNDLDSGYTAGSGINLPLTFKECQAECSKREDCGTIVYQEATKHCWLKSYAANKATVTQDGMANGPIVISYGNKNNTLINDEYDDKGMNQALLNKNQIMLNKNLKNANDLQSQVNDQKSNTDKIASLTSQIATAGEKHSSNLIEYSQLQHDYANGLLDNAALQTQIASSQLTVSELTRELEKDENSWENLIQTHSILTGLNKEASVKLATVTNTGSGLAGDARSMTLTTNNLQEDLDRYRAHMINANTLLTDTTLDISTVQTEIEYSKNVINDYLSQITEQTIFDNSMNSSILQNLNRNVISQNTNLTKTIDDSAPLNLHGQNIYYQNEQNTNIQNMKQRLLYVYYFLVLIIGYVLLKKDWNAYLRVALLLLFLLFPYVVEQAEDIVISVAMSVYNYLNIFSS